MHVTSFIITYRVGIKECHVDCQPTIRPNTQSSHCQCKAHWSPSVCLYAILVFIVWWEWSPLSNKLLVCLPLAHLKLWISPLCVNNKAHCMLHKDSGLQYVPPYDHTALYSFVVCPWNKVVFYKCKRKGKWKRHKVPFFICIWWLIRMLSQFLMQMSFPPLSGLSRMTKWAQVVHIWQALGGSSRRFGTATQTGLSYLIVSGKLSILCKMQGNQMNMNG